MVNKPTRGAYEKDTFPVFEKRYKRRGKSKVLRGRHFSFQLKAGAWSPDKDGAVCATLKATPLSARQPPPRHARQPHHAPQPHYAHERRRRDDPRGYRPLQPDPEPDGFDWDDRYY